MNDRHDRNRGLHVAIVAGHPAKTGGMETFCRFLVRNLLDARWHVTVALSGADIYTDLADASDDCLDVKQVDWLDHTFAGDRNYTWATIRHRRRWFRYVKPDVAVFVQSSNTPLRASVVGAALAGVPVVTTHRTMPWPVEDPPASRHCFGLLPGLHLHRRKVVRKTWLTAALARAVVCNNHAVRTGYETLYAYPHRKTIVIPNAVEAPNTIPDDSLSFGTASASESDSAPFCTVAYVGRISRDKRIDILLHALAKMRTTRPVRLILHGEGPEQPELMQLAGELGLSDRITWIDSTQDVWPTYRRCDIVALCSPRESSSNMILEAMAAGKAVVVTQVGGLPELVDHGRAGICVPPLNVDALTAALDYLADHDPFRRQIGQRARSRTMQLHNPRRIANAWRNVLQAAAGVRIKAHRDQVDAEGMPDFLLTGATDGLPARQY